MPNIVNRMLIQDMTRSFAQAEGMVVCSFGGLDIPETESLRTKLAEQGVEMRMVRNRLARRVLADHGLDFPEDAFAGMTAIAFGSTEATRSLRTSACSWGSEDVHFLTKACVSLSHTRVS